MREHHTIHTEKKGLFPLTGVVGFIGLGDSEYSDSSGLTQITGPTLSQLSHLSHKRPGKAAIFTYLDLATPDLALRLSFTL